MTNAMTSDRLHFEDLAVGTEIVLGTVTLTRDDIVGFAREFDPLPFHVDEKAARRSLLGGLAPSGWQTAGISLRLAVDAFLSKIASAGGLGFSNLKWLRPVMVGDTIGGKVTIAELRRSETHPQWGIVSLDFDIRNQRGDRVMTMRLANLVDTRTAAAGAGS
jgi:acyl dehydratase